MYYIEPYVFCASRLALRAPLLHKGRRPLAPPFFLNYSPAEQARRKPRLLSTPDGPPLQRDDEGQ